ncbi:MAG: orotidine-5'-phosphate decarboxylase [Prochlorococcus sp.]
MSPSLSAEPGDRIIVALDGMTPDQALAFSRQVQGLRWVKVGLELFLQAGPEVVAQLRGQGLRVFLDLKFHDIPATMAGACRRAAALGAELISVHACAGSLALAEAQAAALVGAEQQGLAAPTLLAVTVLTSWDGVRLAAELAIPESIEQRVPALAQLAVDAGIGGCVCSPLEAQALRVKHPDPFALVTPGIRPKESVSGSDSGDQVRVMGPAEAIAAGASQLVIGRPISKAEDPAAAFVRFCEDLQEGQRD